MESALLHARKVGMLADLLTAALHMRQTRNQSSLAWKMMKSVAAILLLVAVAVHAQIGEGDSPGSCFAGAPTFGVFCAVDQQTCEDAGFSHFPTGFVSASQQGPGQGCCHCCAGCDLGAETGTNCSTVRYLDGDCGHVGGPSETSPFFDEEGTNAPSGAPRAVAAATLLTVALALGSTP